MVHVDPLGRCLHVVQNLDSKWQLIHNDDYRIVYLDNLEVWMKVWDSDSFPANMSFAAVNI